MDQIYKNNLIKFFWDGIYMIKIYKMKNNANAGYLRKLKIHAINNGFIIKILPNNNGLFSKKYRI